MNRRTVIVQLFIFAIQWVLMVVGFGLLALVIAPAKLVDPSFPFERYVDAGIKALIALFLSVSWLFLWDKQVRVFFYRRER